MRRGNADKRNAWNTDVAARRTVRERASRKSRHGMQECVRHVALTAYRPIWTGRIQILTGTRSAKSRGLKFSRT